MDKGIPLHAASNQSINAAYFDTKPSFKTATGDKATTKSWLGKSTTAPTGATRTTGDRLAAGNLQDRLGAFKAKKLATPPPAAAAPAKGILQKALGFAKANPLKVGGGLALGYLGARALSNNNQPPQGYGYNY